MHPKAIVRESLANHLDIIAITDHNASENVQYVLNASRGTPLVVIPGMEVCSQEEAHVLALFDTLERLYAFQRIVYANLNGANDQDAFGYQVVVNEKGEVEGFNERLLIGATDIKLDNMVEYIHENNGIAIASHIDRPSYSVISQLGFIPPEIRFDALEVSSAMSVKKARQSYNDLASYTFVSSSDAHFIKDIGNRSTRMYLEDPSFNEIRMALKNENGRYVFED